MADMSLRDVRKPTKIFNDSRNCVDWGTHLIQKAVRHLNIRNSAIRDSIKHNEISLSHIDGKLNPDDLFTKELRVSAHFFCLRDIVVCSRY